MPNASLQQILKQWTPDPAQQRNWLPGWPRIIARAWCGGRSPQAMASHEMTQSDSVDGQSAKSSELFAALHSAAQTRGRDVLAGPWQCASSFELRSSRRDASNPRTAFWQNGPQMSPTQAHLNGSPKEEPYGRSTGSKELSDISPTLSETS